LIGLGEQFSLAVELLLRFSLTCVSISEVCLLLKEYIMRTLMFNHSSCLRDKFSRAYATLDGGGVNMVLLLSSFLRS